MPAFAGMTGERGEKKPPPGPVVIPAKAGIQGLRERRWMPAFAGMTGERGEKKPPPRPVVIPAKAGIQGLRERRWMPAFAGMTGGGFFSPLPGTERRWMAQTDMG
jgi:hypothetical protein